MPRQAADLEEALKKKGGLTLSQLANYDDIVTDALVDRVYYWTTIRKLKGDSYHACRGVREDLVCKILQQHVIIEKDPITAHKKLLELPGLKKYLDGLRSEDEKEHFERHLRKYINIYLPDCPIEVDTTNRYTITTAEACIKARKRIKKGESIKYLSGIQVELTEKEEKTLSSTTDFSIVLSSRRKRPALFLGPARFANHDCDANARLSTTGAYGMNIVALKDIDVDDEVTVSYGEDYFGIDNCECLCGTCESLMRNGWDPAGPPGKEDDDDESDEDGEEDVHANQEEAEAVGPPAILGKRKREEDALSFSHEDENEQPKKRKRGRPRKYPRAEEDTETDAADTSTRGQRDCDSVEVISAEGDDEDQQAPRSHLQRRTGKSTSRESSAESSSNVLQRIVDFLAEIGDRKIRQRSAKAAATETTIASSSQRPSEGPIQVMRNSPGDRLSPNRSSLGHLQAPGYRRTDIGSPSTLSKSPAIVSYATGLSRRSSIESGPPRAEASSPRSSKFETPASKLRSVQRERSVSSLRNVINAEDTEADIYSIASSPAPAERIEQHAVEDTRAQNFGRNSESAGSASPPSSNNDSSSQQSIASSATSLETFTAGSIQQSICDMLTEDDEKFVSAAGLTTIELSGDEDDVDVEQETNRSKARETRGNRLSSTSPRKASLAVRSIETSESADGSDEEDERGPVRVPGDYTLCKALLPTAYHRWVQCRNCDEDFVQGDAYLTRIACQRCERHSKLYGYYWPKTDKEGKSDKEERVLDHRTIHRFIDPEEERNERKGRKTLANVVREREVSSRQDSEESERFEKRLRNSPRRSEARRKLRTTL